MPRNCRAASVPADFRQRIARPNGQCLGRSPDGGPQPSRPAGGVAACSTAAPAAAGLLLARQENSRNQGHSVFQGGSRKNAGRRLRQQPASVPPLPTRQPWCRHLWPEVRISDSRSMRGRRMAFLPPPASMEPPRHRPSHRRRQLPCRQDRCHPRRTGQTRQYQYPTAPTATGRARSRTGWAGILHDHAIQPVQQFAYTRARTPLTAP